MKVAHPLFPSLITAAIVVILSGCQSLGTAPWELPPGVKTRSVNGYPIAYVDRGAGSTVVLVHGGLNDYRYWTPQMESLSLHFRTVAISLRHYYPEPWQGEGRFSIKQHSEDLAAFIESLGVGPVSVVAHSRGGSVAVDLAHLRPDLVRKLVVMDAALYPLIPTSEGGSSAEVRIKRAKATEVYFKKGEMEAGLRYFFDDINGVGAWNKLPEEQRQVRRENAWTIVGGVNDVEERVGCEDIGRFKIPILLMEGERSPQWLKAIRQTFQKCLPSARWVTVPKGTHQMNHTNPAHFNELLIKFLSE